MVARIEIPSAATSRNAGRSRLPSNVRLKPQQALPFPMEVVTSVISPAFLSMRRFHKERSGENCYISHMSRSRVPFWSPMIKPQIVSC